MSDSAPTFIVLPVGGGDQVGINVDEIAAFRGFVKTTTYFVENWTMVSLRSGEQHEVKATFDEVVKRIAAAVSEEA